MRYCDAECQRAHWRAGHKSACKAAARVEFERKLAAACRGDRGDQDEQHNLAIQFLTRKNLPLEFEDAEKAEAAAVFWLRKAAEQGNAMSQHNLDACLAEGIGGVVDEAESAVWTARADPFNVWF